MKGNGLPDIGRSAKPACGSRVGVGNSGRRRSFDHRAVDGATGAELMEAFKRSVGEQADVKRAVVTLEEGHTIDVTTGL